MDKVCPGSQKQSSDENSKLASISPKSLANKSYTNTDKIVSQNILNTFMNAVAAVSLCNNNNNGINSSNSVSAITPNINPGLLYLTQLMGSDLSQTLPIQNSLNNNNNTKSQLQSLPFQTYSESHSLNSQQTTFTAATNTNMDFLSNQTKLLQNTNFLEPLLQCSNYFKFMENYQKYTSNILANSQNTVNKPLSSNSASNNFTNLHSQGFNSVSKTGLTQTPSTTEAAAASFTNGSSKTASNLNRIISQTTSC